VMLKDSLLAAGIPGAAIEVVPDEQEATSRALEIAQPGDLVLVLGDNVKRCWKQIIYFKAGARPEDAVTPKPVVVELPDTEGFRFDESVDIISDERGVRIAREDAD